MTRSIGIFWGTAIGVALTFAIAAAVLLPFEALGIHTAAERERAWLLTLWTGGVLGILFGLSALLGAFGGLGVREVIEAGSLRAALQMRRRTGKSWGGERFHESFAWWVISTGALLIGIYFVGWLTL